MELTVLGSGTAVPSLRRAPPGYLLKIGDDLVVIDPGPGTLGRLLKAGVAHDQVTHILFTHTHLDHSGELAAWLFLERIPSASRRTPLTLVGSAGFMRMLASLRSLYGHWLDAVDYTLSLVTMDGTGGPASRIESGGGWMAQAFPVDHIESSLAFRVTDGAGRVLACTGDTGPTPGLVDLSRDADLLLIESSTPDGMRLEGHLTPSDAADVARSARARRVVLTHFYPACEGVDMLSPFRGAWDGARPEAMMAEDGMRLMI